MQAKAHIQSKCYHCGDEISTQPIVFQGKDFCCEGCKTVYGLLEENNLCTYYNIEDDRLGTPVDFFDVEKFNYLELPEVSEALITFRDGNICHTRFFVPGIHCSSCIWLLENLQRLDEGIRFSRVNFSKKEVSVAFDDSKTSLRHVVELLAKIGYEPRITLDDTESKPQKPEQKRAYVKLGIVGFCFGNMMLISFPEYFTFGQYVETHFSSFFNYLNILFSLPVLYIAVGEYLLPSLKSLRAKQVSIDVPIAIGILALFFTSIYEILVSGQAGYLDSFGGLLFFLLLGKLFQQKTYDALSFDRDYRSYFPISVNKIMKGKRVPVALKTLAVGDEIEIHHQELIPVDSYLLKGEALVDYSFITGESEPVHKKEGDMLFAGGKQMGGNILVAVSKPFSQSSLVSLWNGEAFAKPQASAIDKLTNGISRYFTFGVLAIAMGALLYWLPQEGDTAWKAFVSVLIVACPCALALSSPFALGILLRVVGKARFFLKNALVGEKLWAVDTIVFDKTGTLTDNDKGEVTYTGATLSDGQYDLIRALAAQSTHPLSKRIRQFLGEGSEMPLEELREEQGAGIAARFGNTEIRLGSAEFVSCDMKSIQDQYNGAVVHLSIGGQYKGYFEVRYAYREGMQQTLSQLSQRYELHVLSGDNDAERHYLEQWFPAHALRFNQSPKDKLDFIEQLRTRGKNVMMVGDGLNDAGALKAADVGIAITQNVTSFSPSSDGIMDANALKGLVRFLNVAKSTGNIIKVSFAISILYNVVGLTFAVQGLLTPVFSAILMPLSSITVVLFTTASVQLASRFQQLNKTTL